jgi:hypothetical protein
MIDGVGAKGRLQRKWSLSGRNGAIFAATAVLSLALAACGAPPGSGVAQLGSTTTQASSSTKPSSSSAQVTEALAFVNCMRSRGVSAYPDPSSTGVVPKVSLQQLGISSTVFRTAQTACQHLFPNSGQSSQASNQQMLNAMYEFARCIRSHGVPNWPDPLAESDPGQPGTPGFPRNMPGINSNSPVVVSAQKACRHFLAGIGYASGGYP